MPPLLPEPIVRLDPERAPSRGVSLRTLAAHLLLAAAVWAPVAGLAHGQSLGSPTRLAFDPTQRVLVSDYDRNAVFILDGTTLQVISTIGIAGTPVAVGWGGGMVFVGNETRGAVEAYAPVAVKAGDGDEDRHGGREHRRDRTGLNRVTRSIGKALGVFGIGRKKGESRRVQDEHEDEDDGAAAAPTAYRWSYDLGQGAGAVPRPSDIAVDEGRGLVFVVDGAAKNVKVFAITGALVSTLPDTAAGAPPLSEPTGIAVDPARSEVLVSDFGPSGSYRPEAWIRIYDYNGQYRAGISGDWVPGYEFSRPQGLAVDAAGHIALVDSLLGTVLVFDRVSLLGIARVGELGTNRGQLLLPLDVALHPATGQPYVTNNRQHGLQVLQRSGW